MRVQRHHIRKSAPRGAEQRCPRGPVRACRCRLVRDESAVRGCHLACIARRRGPAHWHYASPPPIWWPCPPPIWPWPCMWKAWRAGPAGPSNDHVARRDDTGRMLADSAVWPGSIKVVCSNSGQAWRVSLQTCPDFDRSRLVSANLAQGLAKAGHPKYLNYESRGRACPGVAFDTGSTLSRLDSTLYLHKFNKMRR